MHQILVVCFTFSAKSGTSFFVYCDRLLPGLWVLNTNKNEMPNGGESNAKLEVLYIILGHLMLPSQHRTVCAIRWCLRSLSYVKLAWTVDLCKNYESRQGNWQKGIIIFGMWWQCTVSQSVEPPLYHIVNSLRYSENVSNTGETLHRIFLAVLIAKYRTWTILLHWILGKRIMSERVLLNQWEGRLKYISLLTMDCEM